MNRRLLLGLIFFISININAAQQIPNIVVSIKPIHSIVSALMNGVSKPQLLLDSNDSAHTFHLKPSQLKLLSNADLLITIGDSFESGLSKVIRNIDQNYRLNLSEIKELQIYDFRDHNEIEYDEHDEHDKDLHLWLDTGNVQIIAEKIKQRLIEINPSNKERYNTNYLELESKLNQLEEKIQLQLEPIKSTPFAIYADILQYFEKNFDLNKPVIIAPYHGARLSINRVIKAKNKMKNQKTRCLIYGSENTSKQINVLTEGLDIKAHSVDILGVKLEPGSEQYFDLMKEISNQLASCLE
jgi:zinc transport system substrate-binding protein